MASGVAHLNGGADQDAHPADRRAHLHAPRGDLVRNNNLKGPDGLAGGEIDVGAVVLLAKGLKLRGLYGVFLPNEGM